MIGVKPVRDSRRIFETDIEAPPSSDCRSFRHLAQSARSRSFCASAFSPFLSAFRMTGTTKPYGVSTAPPTDTYPLSQSVFPSADNDELNFGNLRRTLASADIWNATAVILLPVSAKRRFKSRRADSSFARFARGLVVTWGTAEAAAARFAAAISRRDLFCARTGPHAGRSTSQWFGRHCFSDCFSAIFRSTSAREIASQFGCKSFQFNLVANGKASRRRACDDFTH